MESEILTVSQFHALLNQTLEFAYPSVVIEGEIASFKVNQGKWVFFDLKDETSTIGCFMTVYNLKVALEDGMLVRVVATPNLTKWGKFSLTVKEIELSGEGAVKRAFDLLKAQFEREGLFAPDRKRVLPPYPRHVALITSRQAAAFNDFITIINDRWGGLVIDQAQVQVQGLEAPRQIVRAINYFNQSSDDYDALVLIRGGGSAEDLQAFNHEDVVRAVYGSKIACVVGIGHEDDVSLAELAADVRAATPTDAARRLVPDKHQQIIVINNLHANSNQRVMELLARMETRIEQINHHFAGLYHDVKSKLTRIIELSHYGMEKRLQRQIDRVDVLRQILDDLNPKAVLARGYSLATVDGKTVTSASQIKPNSVVVLQLHQGKARLARIKEENSARISSQKRSNREQSTDQTQLRF